MTKILSRHKYKFIFLIVIAVVLLALTSCRTSAQAWYGKVYTTYPQDWSDIWNSSEGGFWATFWGWPINLLSWPVAWICSNIGLGLGDSFFWGIFFTTIIVRTLAWPIYSKQNGMSLKMQLMQPEMAKVQRKYQGRQDPRSQQMMQQEMMKLYKKYKVNPLGCFGTMILQFPIFMAMYEVVQRVNAVGTTQINGAITTTYQGAFALTNTKVFGFFEMNTNFFSSTASGWDKFFSALVAVLFVGTTILQQKLGQRPPKYQKQRPQDKNQKNQQANQMKWVMIIMNVVFGFMALSNTTLGIYWLIGAVYQIGQSQIGRLINERRYYRLEAKHSKDF